MSSYSYYSAIPQRTDNPSTSQGQMLTNFGSINSIVGVDHVTFGSASNTDGYHKRVSIPAAGNQTVPTNALALIDTALQSRGNYNTLLLPFFTAGALSFPMIPNITPNTQGYFLQIGQLIIYFGTAVLSSPATTYVVDFTILNYQGIVPSVQAITSGNGVVASVASVSKTQVTFKVNSTNVTLYWFAIGY
jgi:hypothetical protein